MDDSEVMKFIVQELAKEPYKQEYNVASFGSLPGKVLLSVFKTILVDISPNHAEELLDETCGSVNTKKTLELLRLLRYWPKYNDPENIRQGLEGPIPEIMWEIMYWLLSRRKDLKERAYLAQFLVKLSIPDEIMVDAEVETCYEEYENEIDAFKETHKRLQEINKEKETRPVGELVSDLGKIDHDIECLGRKVEALRNRVRDIPEKREFLGKANVIRKARDERLRLESQMREEEVKLVQARRKVETLFSRYKEFRDSNQHSTPEGALERAEQDCEVLKFIVDQRLPYKIGEARRSVLAMTMTEEHPPECLADLELSKLKIEEACKEIAFYESQIRSKEMDPSVNFARQQSLNNSMKKIELSEEMELLKEDLKNTREAIESKKDEKRAKYGSDDNIPLTNEGYRDYMKKMRVKAAKYKTMRSELQALQAEIGNLSTTKYILEGEVKSSEENLGLVEKKLGIVGFTVSNDQKRLENLSFEKSELEQKKMDTIYQMATLAKDLNDQVDARKNELEPLINEVGVKRQSLKDIENQLGQLQEATNREMAPINESIKRLKKHFADALDCCEKEKESYAQLSAEIPVMKANLHRANAIAEAPGQNLPVRRIWTFREKLLAEMMESEKIQQSLNNGLTDLEEAHDYSHSQQKMWIDLHEIIQLKLEIRRSSDRPVTEEKENDMIDF